MAASSPPRTRRTRKPGRQATAEHRPAVHRRRWRHDELIAVDLFSGFGGLTRGIERAGFTTIMAANHRRYKVLVHEANHPHADHWIADLVDPESADYHDARDLPAADLLVAGVSCVNHSHANTTRAYAEGLTLFDLEDPDYEARVTRSERDRATANCVLHYAERHRPRMILVECTTELTSWGPAVPGKRKVGDGSTYRWWLKQFGNLNYRHRVLYLNSQFFGVPQSRDRIYIVFWDKRLPAPDLDHRPVSWCSCCGQVVEAVWTWRTGVPPTGIVRYGSQYDYRCPRCRAEVIPPMTPSLNALDLSNLGTRIGDKPVKTHKDGSTGPYAAATMARVERCLKRFPEFPAVVMPAAAVQGTDGHPWQPMAGQAATAMTGSVIPAHRHNGDGQHITRPMDTVTTTHEKAMLVASTGVIIAAAGHTYERPGSDCRSRGLDRPLWAQTGTNATGLLTPPVAVAVDNYQGAPRSAAEPLPTQPGSETLGLVTAPLITAAGTIKNNVPAGEAKYRAHPLSDPLGTVVGSGATQSVLFGGWYKQNGSKGTETAAHPLSDPLGTLTARDTTALLFADLCAEYAEALARLKPEDCYLRMMGPDEVGIGCGFPVPFRGRPGDYIVWGPAKEQIDGFGNAVSPPVGEWIGSRLRDVLYTPEAAA